MKGFGASNTREECPNGEVRSGSCRSREQRPLALADPTTGRSEEFNKRSGRRAHEELEL
jgi:hypothetical protein